MPAPSVLSPGSASGALPRIVIIGGGFGGLYAAQALRRVRARVTLIDRRNHHLFQPLLYQVATAGLSPAQIAAPIRSILSRQRNAEVMLADARRIDVGRRVVELDHGRMAGEIGYDYLIVASGASHSYFGNDAWAPAAPGLKTVADALEIRRRFLLAFERAEGEPDGARRRALMTFVVIGGGPTGVEMAGAFAEIARSVIRRDYRRIDTSQARVLLVEGNPRVLPQGFPPELSERARRDLEAMGVEVRAGVRVTGVEPGDPHTVLIGPERVQASNVVWAAGVKASELGATLGVPMDADGRVIVAPDLSVPGHPEVFVVGDLARVTDPKTGQMVPGLCPSALQMGRHAAGLIAAELRARASGRAAPDRLPFRYRDKGLLATIGRARAVALIGGWRFTGLPAWLLWAGVHIFFLIGFHNRLLVAIDWAWSYLFFQRGARLIVTRERAEEPQA